MPNICLQLSNIAHICIIFLILRLYPGVIELNPVPNKKNSYNNFSLCYSNFYSNPAHDFSKMFLLKASNAQHIFNMVCLSETDDDVSHDDQRLNLNSYKLIGAVNLSNNKKVKCVFILRNFWSSVKWIHNTLQTHHVYSALKQRENNRMRKLAPMRKLPDIQIHLTPSLLEQKELMIEISSIQILVILAIIEYFANPY